MQPFDKNRAMPFLPQTKCLAEWWTSKLSNKIIKKHRKFTKNPKIPKIQSRRKFRPKFEVGRNSAKSAKTAGVALFFPPTESPKSIRLTFLQKTIRTLQTFWAKWISCRNLFIFWTSFDFGPICFHLFTLAHWPIGPPRKISKN